MMTMRSAVLIRALLAGFVLATGVAAQDAERKSGESNARRKKMRERMMKDDGAPKVGDKAPGFTLKSLDGKEETSLEGLAGERPVILLFGSYT